MRPFSACVGSRYIVIFIFFLLGTILYFVQYSSEWRSPATHFRSEEQLTLLFNSEEETEIGALSHSLPQDDPRILNYIRRQGFLLPPSTAPYNLSNPDTDPSMGQSSAVKQILNNMENGFFVECGALDGETRSNTLDLELHYGWKGLLIEGDPTNFALVQQKRRKAWTSNACLATNPYPHQVIFHQQFNMGKIIGNADGATTSSNRDDDSTGKRSVKSGHEVIVQCFPIYSLLAAIGQAGVKRVDYFSLDVEGNEFQVLMTIPWDKIEIRVLSVEYIHDKASISEISQYMNTKGYRIVTQVTNRNNLANDLIFAHRSVKFDRLMLPINS